MRKLLLLILVLWTISAFSAVDRVLIINTTDTHGTLSSRGVLAPVREKHPEAILIDCGDVMQGSLHALLGRGREELAELDKLRYDVFVPGNHDFEYGTGNLLAALEVLQSVQTLAADISGTPLIKPFAVIVRSGYRIGVVGMSERQIPFRVMSTAPLNFIAEEEALDRTLCMPELQNADAIVLARHGGRYFRGGSLYELLKKHPEIDLVLGGHSHEEVPGVRLASGFFVQAGANGKVYAEINLEFDRDSRRLIRISSRMKNLSGSLMESERAAEIVSERPLPTDFQSAGKLALAAISAAVPEADAVYFVSSPREFAPGAARQDLYERYPFANELWTIELDRDEFFRLKAQMAKFLPDYRREFWIDPPESADPVVLAVPGYELAGGGRNDSPLRKHRNSGKPHFTGKTLFEALEAYLKK